MFVVLCDLMRCGLLILRKTVFLAILGRFGDFLGLGLSFGYSGF